MKLLARAQEQLLAEEITYPHEQYRREGAYGFLQNLMQTLPAALTEQDRDGFARAVDRAISGFRG